MDVFKQRCSKGVLTALLGALLLFSGQSARAGINEVVDFSRLHIAVGEHTFIAIPGRIRMVGGHVDPVPIHISDGTLGDEVAADQSATLRLRLTPSATFVGRDWPLFQVFQVLLDAHVDYDMFEESMDMPLGYDPVQQARAGVPHPHVYQAYALLAGQYFAVKAGLMRSHWGTGMLANAGEDASAGARMSPFGFARVADRVGRVQLAFFPIAPAEAKEGKEETGPPLSLAMAADMVIDDDSASWADGDRAYNFIAAVAGRTGWFQGGIYAVHRIQFYAEGGHTELTVFDVHFKQDFARGPVTAWAEIEAAMLFGVSTYSQSAIQQEPFDIASGGGVVRLGAAYEGFEGVLEGGLASGDTNSFDTELHGFSFDREYRVGLLMFREYLRKQTAVTAFNLADATYRAEPPRGFDRVASGGAVRGALYINPRLSYLLVDGLTLMVGYLHATSDGYYHDPYQSALAGGASAGPGGALGRDHLGDEIDLGIDYELKLRHISLRMRAEGAWFAPGTVFESPNGPKPKDLFGVWVQGELRW